MKTILSAVLFLGSISVFGSAEVRFSPELEEKCFKQVRALKCGSPDGKNTENFMKCVDSKIKKLDPDCQTMHKAISEDSHAGHDH